MQFPAISQVSSHEEAHCHAHLLDVECSKGPLWNKQFSVFLEALPDWEKLKHIVVFPLGLHTMPRLKKVEKRGKPIFYFLSPLWQAELKVDPSLRVRFPPPPISRTSVRGWAIFQVATGDWNIEMGGKECAVHFLASGRKEVYFCQAL